MTWSNSTTSKEREEEKERQIYIETKDDLHTLLKILLDGPKNQKQAQTGYLDSRC